MKIVNNIPILILTALCILISGVTAASISSAPADTTGTPPQNVTAYIDEAQAAVSARNWPDALTITTRGLAWYPDSAGLLGIQGYSYRKMGQYERAVEAFSEAITLDPKPVLYSDRGYAYLALNKYTSALADAESGITIDTAYPAAYGVRALALQGVGKNTEALAAIETAITLAPGNAHYWHVKGRILSAQGDCTRAAAALEKSFEIDPDYILPYPGFGSAEKNLASLDTACNPQAALPATSPAKSPSGAILPIIAAFAFFAVLKR